VRKHNKNLIRESKIEHGNHNHPAKIESISIKIIGTSQTQEKSNITKTQKIDSGEEDHIWMEEVEKSSDKKNPTKINHKVNFDGKYQINYCMWETQQKYETWIQNRIRKP